MLFVKTVQSENLRKSREFMSEFMCKNLLPLCNILLRALILALTLLKFQFGICYSTLLCSVPTKKVGMISGMKMPYHIPRKLFHTVCTAENI